MNRILPWIKMWYYLWRVHDRRGGNSDTTTQSICIPPLTSYTRTNNKHICRVVRTFHLRQALVVLFPKERRYEVRLSDVRFVHVRAAVRLACHADEDWGRVGREVLFERDDFGWGQCVWERSSSNYLRGISVKLCDTLIRESHSRMSWLSSTLAEPLSRCSHSPKLCLNGKC